MTTQKTRFVPLQATSKIEDYTSYKPNELGTTTSKVAKRNPDTARLWNDYVFQIATR